MPVPAAYVGQPYRQIASVLKIRKDRLEASATDVRRVSARPLRDADQPPSAANPYTDSEEEPHVVTFEADDDVDVAMLLAAGAIVPVAEALRTKAGSLRKDAAVTTGDPAAPTSEATEADAPA